MTFVAENPTKSNLGLILFARYAFAPNYFRYCGPDKNRDIASALIGEYEEDGLSEILIKFEAAVPYLNLIARSNYIKDIFDPRVVEAYWLGNELLFNVKENQIFQHLDQNVRKRAGRNWSILMKDIKEKAKPHHSFHVFEIYRTAGFSRDGAKSLPIIDLINKCRISAGRVKKVDPKNQEVLIAGEQIALVNQKLMPIKKDQKAIFFRNDIKVGDLVSIHWGFVCDKISERQLNNLDFWARYHLRITNKSI